MNYGIPRDYISIKDANDNELTKVMSTRIITLKGNVLNFSFISDESVTQRGFAMDIYLTREEEMEETIISQMFLTQKCGRDSF